MTIEPLNSAERMQGGFTHRAIIDFADLAAKGATTSGVFTLFTATAGRYLFGKVAGKLVSGFVGASVTNLTVKVGYNLASGTDDDDAFLEAIELATAGTEILTNGSNGAAFATKLTGYAPQEAATIEATFTSTGANLSAMTAGKYAFLFTVIDLNSLCPSS